MGQAFAGLFGVGLEKQRFLWQHNAVRKQDNSMIGSLSKSHW